MFLGWNLISSLATVLCMGLYFLKPMFLYYAGQVKCLVFLSLILMHSLICADGLFANIVTARIGVIVWCWKILVSEAINGLLFGFSRSLLNAPNSVFISASNISGASATLLQINKVLASLTNAGFTFLNALLTCCSSAGAMTRKNWWKSNAVGVFFSLLYLDASHL